MILVEGYGFYDGFPVEGGQGGEGGGGRDPRYPPQMYGSVNEQIAVTLMRLQQDMHTVLQRLDSLEAVSRQQVNIYFLTTKLGRAFY